MTAPVPASARGVPSDVAMDEGFPIKIVCDLNPTICFWEKDVKPPEVDQGDMIEVTTQHAVEWEQFAARVLSKLGDTETTAGWHPNLYPQIFAIKGKPATWTIIFPNGATLAFFGVLQTATPQDMSKGKYPEIKIKIAATNRDHNDPAKPEQGPVYTPGV